MTDYAVCTSWSEPGRHLYGDRFLKSFVDCWPNSVRLYVFEDSTSRLHEDGRVVIQPMPIECTKWMTKHAFDPTKRGYTINGYNFKLDAVKFANKVFAIAAAFRHTHVCYDRLIWLDGDVYTHSTVDEKWLDQFAPGDDELCSYLGRREVPENGFIMFNLNHPNISNFIKSWVGMYHDGSVFRMRIRHDCSTLLANINAWKEKGVGCRDIGEPDAPDGTHVFIRSALGECMDHMKGSRKSYGHSRWSEVCYTENSKLAYWQNIGKESNWQ